MFRHLELLNVLLALRIRQPGFPTCLQETGYLVHSIGSTIRLADGAKVTPDVLTSRRDPDMTFIVEVKGGRAFDADQLTRMQRLDAEALRDFGHLPVRDTATHKVQIVYLCDERVREEYTEQIGTRRAAVIGFDGERFRLSGQAIADPDLGDSLADARVDPGPVPLVIPFDQESPEEEVARAVIPHVIEALLQGMGTISPEQVVSRTHYLLHDAMRSTGSGSELKQVVARAKIVLKSLAVGELSEWLEPIQGQPLFRFRRGLSAEGASKTREFQRLRRACEGYLETLGSHRGLQLELTYPEADNVTQDPSDT